LPITLGSNIQSLGAQRQLASAGNKLSSVFEKLSSGQRINRASDDAAGLAIAASLNVNAKVFTQAVRNLNDGISYLAITEGATSAMKGIILRSQELASQAANGVYSDKQRQALNQEAQAMAKEYNRIIDTTKFNGKSIFMASNGELIIQAGYGTTNGRLIASIDGGDSPTNFVSQLTSVSSDGVEGNGISASSTRNAISADGRYSVFQSSATNLVEGGTSGQQIFIRDLQTGETKLVSVSNDGVEGSASSSNASISADGRYVVFQSSSSNLVEGGSSNQQIFRHDVFTGKTTLVSASSDGVAGVFESSNATISADGRYAVFQSSSTNLVDGGTTNQQIFVRDLQTGKTTLISASDGGIQGSSSSASAHISADGRYAVFQSASTNLVGGTSGTQIFLKNIQTGEITLASSSSSGVQGNSQSTNAQISDDGRYMTFQSLATNLIDGGSAGTHVFHKNLLTGETKIVSSSATGEHGDGISAFAAISGDGRYILFLSQANNLVENTPVGNVLLVKDTQTGSINIVGIGGAQTGSISGDGRFIFSAALNDSPLAPGTNGTRNTFVATNTLIEQNSLSRLMWFNLSSEKEANNAQNWLKTYAAELDRVQGGIGAFQSRFGSAIKTLSSMSENSKAAESRIKDADMADLAAQLTRISIIQQAASAVLAQANQQPALALQLLGQ